MQSLRKYKNLSEKMAISFVTNLPAKTHTNHTCKRKCATTERHAANGFLQTYLTAICPPLTPANPGLIPARWVNTES